jgi:RNA polymerase sigma-70 factor (ECF subfamily)
MNEDLELARRALGGEAEALSELDRRIRAEGKRVADAQRFPADELAQLMRARLLAGPDPKLARFDGSGPLAAWLRAVAARLASNARRPVEHEVAVSAVPEGALAEPTPELALLRLQYREHFRAAFADAVRALEPNERTVLRLHTLDGLSLASIGTMFQRDASNVSRWLSRIRGRLLEDTRAALGRRLLLEGSALESLMRVADSELTMSLSGLLS